MTNADETELSLNKHKYYKGHVPELKVWAHRVQNKKQTVITGFEMYKLDMDELQTYLSNKCACSVSVQELNASTKAILLQGNHLSILVSDILPNRYKIPQKYIREQNDLGTSKKKKKK